jgi:hypothetical protein
MGKAVCGFMLGAGQFCTNQTYIRIKVISLDGFIATLELEIGELNPYVC